MLERISIKDTEGSSKYSLAPTAGVRVLLDLSSSGKRQFSPQAWGNQDENLLGTEPERGLGLVNPYWFFKRPLMSYCYLAVLVACEADSPAAGHQVGVFFSS